MVRSAGRDSRTFRFAGCIVDLSRRTLLRDGAPVALRPRSFDVLARLVERAGDVVPRDEFFETVWSGLAVTDESLSRCISDIRGALGDRQQQVVKTVPGRGYLLAAPVARVAVPRAGAREPAPAQTAVVERPSIAVLPFLHLGAEAAEEWIADGFTEDITSALSRLREILVIARSTMFTFKGRAVDVRALARDLGVRYVLEGSVRRLGPRIRVSAQLVEAPGGNHLWAETYDREFDQLFAIQDEISASIAGRIGPELLAAEFARSRRKPPRSLNAWECVIRALFHSSQQSDEATRTALSLLQRSIEHQGDFAQALGMTAWILVFRAFQGWEEMPVALARADALIARALAVDNEELWPYLAQGMVGFARRDNGLSMAALERAVAISPNSVNAHGLLGVAHAFGGRADASLAEIATAMRLSPRDTYLSDFELYNAFAHFQAARYERTLHFADEAHRRRPGHPYPLVLAASCAGHLARAGPATTYLARLKAVVPVVSTAWVGATSPYILEDDRRRLVEGLARAGLE